MKSTKNFILAVIAISHCFSGCKKEDTAKHNISFANQSLNEVLKGIRGPWRAVYYVEVTIAGSSQTPVSDTSIGYYTWFYADHMVTSNRAGDSLSSVIIWRRVANDSDSLYAFRTPDDPSSVFAPGYAVFDIVNDTLRVGTVGSGPDYGGGILYKKD